MTTAVKEVFGHENDLGKLGGDELKLFGGNQWTIWENIDFLEKKESQAQSWENKMKRVGWFDNLLNFAQVWNSVPHARPSEILYDQDVFKVFQDGEGSKYMVSAINLFKTGVIPMWEDEKNKNGSEFRVDLHKTTSPSEMDAIWKTLVEDLVTGTMPAVNETVVGVRLVQKQKNFQFMNFRIELWLTNKDEHSEPSKKLKAYLEELSSQYETANIKFEDRDNKY